EGAALEERHRPRPAIAHVRGQVHAAGARPVRLAFVAVDFRQRERAAVELAVVDRHAHDFLLLPQPPGRDPALALLVAEDPRAVGPPRPYHPPPRTSNE